MKKILYIITKSNWGGAQKYVFDLATSLPKEEFSAVVASGGSGKLQNKLQEKEIPIIKIESLSRDISLVKDIKVFFEIYKICKKEKPEVVHLNSSKIGSIGSLASRIAGVKKIIFTAHGWAFNEKRSLPYKILLWVASLSTCILSTDIIVLSKKEEEQTKKFPFVNGKKIHLIRNGLKEETYLSKEIARKELDLSPDKKYVGTIAELHPNKGLDILIHSFKNLPAELVVIGSGEEEQKLRNVANSLGISDKVHFLGNIDNASTYLKAFDVFALSSRKEGLPYVLLEASKAGLEIVATRVGGVPEIIIDGKTGLLAESDNLKEKIQILLNEKRFGENAKKHVSENFSFQKTLKSTLKLYHSL